MRKGAETELKDMGLTWGEANSLVKDIPGSSLQVASFSGRGVVDK